MHTDDGGQHHKKNGPQGSNHLPDLDQKENLNDGDKQKDQGKNWKHGMAGNRMRAAIVGKA